MNLLDLGFRVIAVLGLGLIPFNLAATPMSNGGAVYQRSIPQPRDFTLAGEIYGSLSEMQRIQKNLIGLVSPAPDRVGQPLRLIYQRYSECGNAETGRVLIDCTYASGLDGQITNENENRLGLTFRQFIPYLRNEKETGSELSMATLNTPYSNVAKFDSKNGILNNLAAGLGLAGDVGGGIVYTIAGKDNSNVYFGGDFSKDTANTLTLNSVARWTGLAWAAMGSGFDSSVRVLYLARDGTLYAGGLFDNSGATPVAKVARWTGSAWAAMGSGVTIGTSVEAIIDDSVGNLYLAGIFTQINGSLAANRIVKWNPVTRAYSLLGTGLNGTAWALAIDEADNLFVGGAFTTANGVTVNGLGRWNGTTFVSVGMEAGATVYSLLWNKFDGMLYALYTVTGIPHFKKYTGTAWEDVIPDLDYTIPSSFPIKMFLDEEGGIYTNFVPDSYSYGFGRMAYYRNGAFSYPEADFVGNGFVTDEIGAIITINDALYFSGEGNVASDSGSIRFNYQDVVSDAPIGSYPVFRMKGPGQPLSIKNYRDGRTITFSTSLYLAKDEVAILSLRPGKPTFESNLRGNLMSYISQSSFNLQIYPDTNRIAIQMIRGSTSSQTLNAEFDASFLLGYDSTNTDDYKLYVSVIDDGAGDFHVELYSDSGRTVLVGHTASGGAGSWPVIEDGSSGLGGRIITGLLGTPAAEDFTAYFSSVYLIWPDYHFSLEEAIR